jgi:DNA-binding NarL/FixJ family response regulator
MAAQLNPDLIILDLAMPILDGLHAADEILCSNPAIPILLYTLHKTDAIELAAKKAGVRHVVAKTEGTNALLSRAQGLLVPNAISALLLPEIQATVDSTARISDAEPQRQADAGRSGAAQSS